MQAHRDSVAAYSSFLSRGRLPTWKRCWLLGTVTGGVCEEPSCPRAGGCTSASQGWGMDLSFPGLEDGPQLPRAGIPWHWCRARQGSALLNDLLKPFLQWFSRGSDPSTALVLLCRVGVLCQGAVPPQGALLMPAAPRIPLSLTFACSRPSLQSRACPKQGARAGMSRGLSVLPDAS